MYAGKTDLRKLIFCGNLYFATTISHLTFNLQTFWLLIFEF